MMKILERVFCVIILIILTVNCNKAKKDIMIYKANGIPSVDQSFSYMYFKNEKEGYLFGEYQKYLNLDESIKNPEIRSEIVFERNIYKTVDGGHNWKKIESFSDGKKNVYVDNGIVKNGNIYVCTTNISDNDDRFIDIFSLEKNRIIKRKKSEFNSFILLLGNKRELYSLVSDKYGNNHKIITYDSEMSIVDSMNVNKISYSKGNIIDNNVYVIGRDNYKGNLQFSFIDEKGFTNKINLPIYPNSMIQKSSTDILLVGNDKFDDDIHKIVDYDIGEGQDKTIKKINGYSIVKDFKSNGKIVAGFLGNIKGHYVEYDLVYSQDNGKTWKIKELNENKSIQPSCLIGDVLYIYSSEKKIQKVSFNK